MTAARPWRRRIRAPLALLALAAAGWAGLDHWVRTAPMPDLAPAVSDVALDREGALLRAWQVADGRWRMAAAPGEVDPGYLAQLLAYEDGRFRRHAGVDALALGRAAGQALRRGRIVSGASTLTMQAARLLGGATTRTLAGKLAQIRLALALERRLSKDEILALYLTLAPFGGNIEGVRAASLAWFGKEPRRLTPAEAALLVALPQSPEARRPDRFPAAARAARDRVLARAVAKGALTPGEAAAARREPVPTRLRPFPRLAPHLTERERVAAGAVKLTVDRALQASLEDLAADYAATLPPSVSVALVAADRETGEVLAHVGSPGYDERGRGGYVDMTRALRSPGSTLKPLIYGMAFEAGLAHPESLAEDRPTAFGDWTPVNFDGRYNGTVSLRDALQSSLNIPAVTLLDQVGPARLMARLRRAGATPVLPPGRGPGLAIGLGGVGLTLEDLVALFAGIANQGMAEPLAVRLEPDAAADHPARRILSPQAAWQVADILAGAPAPPDAPNGQLAFKTGTSYGHRDAWAIGFDGGHAIGVWIGRPDAGAVPGITGAASAAPLLFRAFARLKPALDPLPPPPPDTLIAAHGDLPPPLRHVRGGAALAAADAPRIAFPPDGARIALAAGEPLALKLVDGRPPFTWLIDGRPVATRALERETLWRPDGIGHVAIAVIDRMGNSARAEVRIEER